MKFLLLAVTLLSVSFFSFAENPPPANAFRGTMYGYEVAIYINPIFSGNNGLRTVYKVDGGWRYLVEPDYFEGNADTKSKADAEFSRMISEINAAAYEQLQSISLEPDFGTDRIQWLLENKLSIVDNELIVN